MYWPLPLHPNTFGLNWQVATKENPFASIFRTINSVNAILSGRSNEDLTGNRVKCGFKRSCDWKCLLSEETVLSLCGLHHKIKPQYGGKNYENDDVLQELSFWGSISIWQITLVTHLLVSFSATTVGIYWFVNLSLVCNCLSDNWTLLHL